MLARLRLRLRFTRSCQIRLTSTGAPTATSTPSPTPPSFNKLVLICSGAAIAGMMGTTALGFIEGTIENSRPDLAKRKTPTIDAAIDAADSLVLYGLPLMILSRYARRAFPELAAANKQPQSLLRRIVPRPASFALPSFARTVGVSIAAVTAAGMVHSVVDALQPRRPAPTADQQVKVPISPAFLLYPGLINGMVVAPVLDGLLSCAAFGLLSMPHTRAWLAALGVCAVGGASLMTAIHVLSSTDPSIATASATKELAIELAKLLAFRFSGSIVAPILVNLLRERAELTDALRSPLLLLEASANEGEDGPNRAWRRHLFALGNWLYTPSSMQLAVRRFAAQQGWLDLESELLQRGQPTERMQHFLANAKDDASCLEACLLIGYYEQLLDGRRAISETVYSRHFSRLKIEEANDSVQFKAEGSRRFLQYMEDWAAATGFRAPAKPSAAASESTEPAAPPAPISTPVRAKLEQTLTALALANPGKAKWLVDHLERGDGQGAVISMVLKRLASPPDSRGKPTA